MNSFDKILLNNQQSKIIHYKNLCDIKLFLCEPYEKHSSLIEKNLMIILLNGKRKLNTKDKKFDGNAGDMFFVRSGTYIISEVMNDVEHYGALIFAWKDEFINNFIKANNINTTQQTKNIEHIFQIIPNKMLKYSADTFLPLFLCKDKIDERIIKHKLEEMLLMVLNSDTNSKFINFLKSITNNQSLKIKNTIEENILYEDIQDISNKAGEPINNFRKEFSKIYGTMPQKWLIQKKLETAKVLLMYDDKNISEVCTEVGYSNLSWFIKQFKKEFGITPKQFQKQHKL